MDLGHSQAYLEEKLVNGQEVIQFPVIVGMLLFAVLGAWIITEARRVIRTPTDTRRPTVFNWLVRTGSQADSVFFGGKLSVQFVAWFYLLLGIGLELLVALFFVALLWRWVS